MDQHKVQAGQMARTMRSFGFAWKGIVIAVKEEYNLRIHLVAIAVVTTLGLYLGLAEQEWIMIVFCFGMVITAELINSAIERLVDLVSPGHNPNAGIIKDIAAGAVLVSAIVSAIIGMIIFLPKL